MKDFKQGAQVHPGLVEAGEAMGFAKGGQVKKMDPGVMPASEGTTEQEKEAGGHGKLKPGYKEGGKVEGYTRCKMGGKVCYKKGGKVYMMKGGKMVPYGVGGAVAKGAKKVARTVEKSAKARNRVTKKGHKRSEGEAVKAVGRGSKNVSK